MRRNERKWSVRMWTNVRTVKHLQGLRWKSTKSWSSFTFAVNFCYVIVYKIAIREIERTL